MREISNSVPESDDGFQTAKLWLLTEPGLVPGNYQTRCIQEEMKDSPKLRQGDMQNMNVLISQKIFGGRCTSIYHEKGKMASG